MWAAIMPGFHLWAGNPEFVAHVLRFLFGFSFRFTENVAARYDIPTDLQCRLGLRNSRLGDELVIGRSFREYDSSYALTVSDVNPDDVADLLPGKPLEVGVFSATQPLCKAVTQRSHELEFERNITLTLQHIEHRFHPEMSKAKR
jgi:predicted component of type VI protein secretion system